MSDVDLQLQVVDILVDLWFVSDIVGEPMGNATNAVVVVELAG